MYNNTYTMISVKHVSNIQSIRYTVLYSTFNSIIKVYNI